MTTRPRGNKGRAFVSGKAFTHANPTDTEAQAAAFIKPKVKRLIDECYALIVQSGDRGMIGSDIAEKLDAWVYSVKPRLVELAEAGLIECRGQRPNIRGRNEMVFVATPRRAPRSGAAHTATPAKPTAATGE